jgi:5'(3')-deoxyribonucleotidase
MLSLHSKMKIILSILLLLITGTYILPVKEFIKGDTVVCTTDMDTEKEESSKKDKIKELFAFNVSYSDIINSYCNNYQQLDFVIPAALHIVETPPPDLA